MEEASWKKLILSWVNNSGLLEKPSMFLDQTDLDVFYTEYRKLMMRVTIPELNIRDFLKAQYPAFQTHLFDDNEICSADYVYIYCLLLHYSCVICKDEKFQSICMNLTGSQQESIASLFSRLVHKDNISRASLKNTLRETAPQSPIEFMHLGSPIRTPLKTSPSTPGTKLLEERSRELISVKAQLETERYERNFLEMQMKETEGKLKQANQQQKTYIVEIKQLKEKLLYGDEQNIPLNREKRDVFTLAGYQRQIQQLEDKIFCLNTEVDAVTRDRCALQQKNSLMEKELTGFREKFHEQRILNEDIQADLQDKMRLIADLESVNQELKLFIKEIKPSNTDLNTTDSLDFSFNSSSSQPEESPENLAKTVVEVQLREKEAENLSLRTTLATLEEKSQKIAREIVNFMQKHSAVIDTDIPKIIPNEDNLQYVVFAFESATEKLLEREVEMKRTLGKAEAEQLSLVETIARLNDECARMKQEMNAIMDKEKSTEENLSRITEEFGRKCKEMESANREVYSLRSVNVRYEKIIEENEELEKELSDQINELKMKLYDSEKQMGVEKEEQRRITENLQGKVSESVQMIKEQEEHIEKFQSKTEMLEKTNSVLTNKISDMSSIIKTLQEIKESRNLEIAQLSEQLKSQRSEKEQLKASVESLSFEQEELKAEIDTKVHDMKDLKEINRISGEKITALENLLEESSKKSSEFLKANEELRQELEESQREKKSLSEEKTSLEYQIKDSDNLVDELKNQIASFEAQEIEFSKNIDSLNMEIEMYKTDSRKIHSKKSELLKQSEMQKTQCLHLLKEIECHVREITALNENLKEKENLLGMREAANAETVAALNKQRVLLEESKKEMQELTEEFNQLKEKCSVLEEEKQGYLCEVERLSQVVDRANEKQSTDADALVKLNEELRLVSSESSQAHQKVIEFQEEMLSRDKLIKDLEGERDKQHFDLSEMREITIRNTAKIQELEKQIEEDSRGKEEMSKNQKEELSSLQHALAETYKKNEDLSATVVKLEEMRKEMESRLEAEITEKLSVVEKLTQEEEAQSQLKEELQCVRNDLMDRKSHCGKLANEITEIKKKMESLSCQLSDQKSQNDDLKEKIKSLGESEVDSKVRIVELQGEVDKLTREIQELEVFRREEARKIDKLTEEVTVKEVLVQQLRDSMESLKKNFGEIEEKLKEEISHEKSQKCQLLQEISHLKKLESDLATLQATLTEKNTSNETLSLEISQLKENISSKTVQITDLTKKLEVTVTESEKQVEQLNEIMSQLQEKSIELLRMEEDRKSVNEKAKQLLEEQQNFEVKCSQYEERIKLLCESKSNAIDVLQKEISGLEKRNIDMSENLKSLEGELAKQEREYEDLTDSRGEILEENTKLKEEIQSIESQNDEITQKVLDSDGEIQNLQREIKKLLSERHNLEAVVTKLSDEKSKIETSMLQKNEEILNMRIEMGKRTTELSTDSIRIATLLKEVEKYKNLENQVKKLECLENKEKEINERLVNENAILQAKLFKHRQILDEKEKSWDSEREALNKTIAEKSSADDRVSETKREMEGKLEKMKEKMKTLCNAEIEKTKLRFERDFAINEERAENKAKSLSQQIAILNSKQLELVKENTNLKRMMRNTQAMKKPMMPQMSLNMEDEEGEQFNNTYLMRDVKMEQTSFFGRESVTKEELDRRNSRQPPHLKSQYAAQYGIDNFEDDATSIGEGNVHDDSMSSLLYVGQKKKLSGTTSYKRPGPPTPSKNGGRLSFGGTGEVHPRQILKEMNESTKQQTPSTLRTLFGRRSLARDEVMPVESCQSSCSVESACWALKGLMRGDQETEDTSSDSGSVRKKSRKSRKPRVSINMTNFKKKRFTNVLQTHRKRQKNNRMEKFNEFRQIDVADVSESWIEVFPNKSAEKKFERIALQTMSVTPFVGATQNNLKRRFSTPVHVISSPPSPMHSSAKCSGGVSISERIPRSEVIRLPRRQLLPCKKFHVRHRAISIVISIIFLVIGILYMSFYL